MSDEFSSRIVDEDHALVTQHLTAMVMGVKQGYPGMDGADGCGSLYLMPDKTKTSCPVEKGKQYMYRAILPVKNTFPKVE